jgi:hypothetical protein
MNVRSIAVAPDQAVITLVNDHEIRITRAWLADQFLHAAGRSATEKRDAVLAALRSAVGDPVLLPGERVWVDFQDDGTIVDLTLTRDGQCPFDCARWQHLRPVGEIGEEVR